MSSRVFICRWSMLSHNSSFICLRMAILKLLLSPTLEGNWIEFLSPNADFYFPILFIYFLDGWGVASIHVFLFLDSICCQYMIVTHDTLSVVLVIAWVYSDFLEFLHDFHLQSLFLSGLSCCEALLTAIFVVMRKNFCIILRHQSLVLISFHYYIPCLSCADKLNLSPSWKF